MRAANYIKQRQVLWARREGIRLQGSHGERGEPAYTRTLRQNLFGKLGSATFQEYETGDGKEVKGHRGNPPKMQAVHSTSALVCNVFDYWRRQNQLKAIAEACAIPAKGIHQLNFETKLPVSGVASNRFSPNIDVLFRYSGNSSCRAVGVECKFSESYGGRDAPSLSETYVKAEDLWKGLDEVRDLARAIIAGK